MPEDKLDISPNNAILRRIAVCVVFSLILIILLGFNYRKYFRAQKKFKQENSRLLALEKDIGGLKESIQRFKQERQRLETMLFTDKDIAEFLDKIAELAKKTQVKITNMQAQRMQGVISPGQINPNFAQAPQQKKEAPGPQFAALPINMTVEAQFERIVSFLLSSEKSRQLLTLSNVSIKRGAYPLLTCKFTLRLYSLKKLEEIYKK